MRRATIVGVVILLALIPASVGAQFPPHKFYGSSDAGSGALVNGAGAGNGAVVTAINQRGAAVGYGVVTGGTWAVSVDPSAARSVFFVIGDSTRSPLFWPARNRSRPRPAPSRNSTER